MKLPTLEELAAQRAEMIAKIDEREAELRAELAELEKTRAFLAGGAAAPAAAPSRKRAPAGESDRAVLAWIDAHPGPHTLFEIATALSILPSRARDIGGQLYRDGKIARVSRGVYESKGKPAAERAPVVDEASAVVEQLEREDAKRERVSEPIPIRRETPADRLARVNQARAAAPPAPARKAARA